MTHSCVQSCGMKATHTHTYTHIKRTHTDDAQLCTELWDESRQLLAPMRAVLLDACTLFPALPRPYLQLLRVFGQGTLAASAAYTHLQVGRVCACVCSRAWLLFCVYVCACLLVFGQGTSQLVLHTHTYRWVVYVFVCVRVAVHGYYCVCMVVCGCACLLVFGQGTLAASAAYTHLKVGRVCVCVFVCACV